MIKIMANIFMLIDHIGYIYYPDVILLRLIGRLSFPLFAYQLTNGYRYTSNFKLYLKRILIMAIISQVPFGLLFNTYKLNVLFTLLFSLLFLKNMENKKYLNMIFILLLVVITQCDYGIYGLLTVVMFYYYEGKKNDYIKYVLLNLVYILIGGYYYQIFSILSLFLLELINRLKSKNIKIKNININDIKLNKKLGYMIYPLHLIVLGLIN